MATHVIEIVGGIGEPAFVPLTMGKESPTLSIGRRGQWKVEGAGILDVHAYAYFDGQALFLQSTDPNNAASVDGFPVGTAWTEVRPPCSIELGGARLEYREEDSGDDATQAIATPMAAGRPPTPPPAAGRPPEQSRQTNPPPLAQTAPIAPPARPFQPGAFSSRQEDEGESTRVAPLDVSVSRAGPRPPGAFAGVQQPAMLSGAFPNPMLQQPQMGQMGPGQMGQMGPGQMGQMGQMGPGQMGQMGQMGPGMQQPMMDPNGYGMAPQQPMMGSSGSGGFPQQQQQGAYGFPGQGSGVDAYGQPLMAPPAAPPQEEDALKKAIADFKAASPVRKMVLIILPVAMICGAIMLLSDDPPPPVAAKPDAGAPDATTAQADAAPAIPDTVVQTNPQVPPGPGPGPAPSGGTVPDVAPSTPPATSSAPTGRTPPPPSPLTTSDAGTLERKALDELYRGDLAKSAEAYEKLAQEQPQNPSYAYAAKILRERLAAGQGAPPPTGAPK